MPPPSDRYVDVARQFREAAGGESLSCTPATPEHLTAAQQALGCRFPDSYVWFQLEFGEVANSSFDIYSVRPSSRRTRTSSPSTSRSGVRRIPRFPAHLIAFSDNGGGDFVCFDTSAMKDGETPIVWWDHEGDEDQVPEPAAASFLDWIEAELRERAEEEPHSLLENMGPMYQSWLSEWLKKK